jgi:drug/metabolite transporter (DMT)-like permease
MVGILLGLFGMTLYSTGVIMQKKGSVWMTWKTKRNNEFIKMLGLWLFGIIISYVISAFPTGAASKDLPSYVVAAMSGWSILVIVFFSCLFLKEKLYSSDIFYAVIIIGCIVMMSIFSGSEEALDFDFKQLYYLLFVPFILLVPVFFKGVKNKHKTILLSVFSGISGGLVIVFMNILVKESGGSIGEIVSSPYIYIYFLAGIVSKAAIQAAYRFGDVILITPLQTSLSIMYPILCSYFLLNSNISAVQVVSILLIVICCWGILKKR